MIKHLSMLGFVPALALAACGGNENTSTDTNTGANGNMSGIEMPSDANMADNGMGNAMAGQAALSPQQFADNVGASDAYEIAAGKLAQEKAQSKDLKAFGKMMVEHHTQSTQKLKAAGAKANPAITPNPALTAEQESNLAALRSAEGAAFDSAYKTQQVAAHQKALALVQGYAATGETPELKAFAGDAQKIVQAHLTRIQGM